MTASLETAHVLSEIDPAIPLDRCVEAFDRRGAFFLDGGGATLFGAEPIATLRADRTPARTESGQVASRVVIRRADGVVTERTGDALDALRDLLAGYAPATPPEARPIPLLGGAVGYVGYETGQTLERLPCVPRPGPGMPDVAFGVYRWVLGARDGRSWLSVFGHGDTSASARADAERTRDRILRAIEPVGRAEPLPTRAPLRRATSTGDRPRPDARDDWTDTLPRERYLERVREAKRHIEEGDAFEICLTRAVSARFEGDPWRLFRALRRESPAPYAAILDLPEGAIVSSSPERFLRLEGRLAESRPIKGTRPRGATPDEDARLAEELRASPKDRAENAMIVDLVRNDLGKVCRYGTVTAPDLYAVERYATVHQLVSTVRGELAPERDAIDLLRACFPPGSMTGAPKIEAMRILERLEPAERGPYAGALGYVDFDGSLDLAVVIRSIVLREGRAYVGTGGAVVADSDPAAEHEETAHKARALLAALAEAAR